MTPTPDKQSKSPGAADPHVQSAPALPAPEYLGDRIRRLRMERGLSQDRLAIEAHVDQSGLSKFERGKNRQVGVAALQRIAAVLQTTYDDLVQGTTG